MDRHGLTKMSRAWKIGELLHKGSSPRNCTVFARIDMDCPGLEDWMVVVLLGWCTSAGLPYIHLTRWRL